MLWVSPVPRYGFHQSIAPGSPHRPRMWRHKPDCAAAAQVAGKRARTGFCHHAASQPRLPANWEEAPDTAPAWPHRPICAGCAADPDHPIVAAHKRLAEQKNGCDHAPLPAQPGSHLPKRRWSICVQCAFLCRHNRRSAHVHDESALVARPMGFGLRAKSGPAAYTDRGGIHALLPAAATPGNASQLRLQG